MLSPTWTKQKWWRSSLHDRQYLVVDAGPLIARSIGNCLEILEKLYVRVSVPEAVIKEVIDCGEGRVGTAEVANARFIHRERLDEDPDPLLSGELGAGEAEVIALGYQRKASLVILDDRRARRIASQAYGLRVKGAAG
ncbi:MAG: hypothetical protein GY847_02085, partial [Proteobacteria bacterium]|nr:hypothetical protein [Pseudomonadota bacterium]